MNKAESGADFEKNKRIKLIHYSSPENNSNSSKVENSNSSLETKNSDACPKKENLNSIESENSNACPETGNSESEKNSTGIEDIKKKELINFSSFVAAHYNSIRCNFEKRNDSRIVYLRNFNNWIKSILIKDSVSLLPEQKRRNLRVLDMCCGKGGDLFKWNKLNLKYMICTDIAENSLEQYKERYNNYINNSQRNGNHCIFECEFIPADCTRVRLRGKYQDPSISFDIVSCQFSFHYCFESLPQAECMLKNASECLKPGGLFIGTMPSANEIVKRLKQSKAKVFRNDIFAVEMCCSEPYPLFGAKYNFYLEGVVNCPEFLVHFPTFMKLAAKYGLELVQRENFTDYFEKSRKTYDGEMLLKKIKALETYPPINRTLVGPSGDYIHAKIYCEQNNAKQVGTLSKSEWEVISLYQIFVFTKTEAK